MTVLATPPTFGFENCVDLVWKLDWEIARLLHATPHDVIDMKCFAFNAASTAWHLTEWVYENMTPAQRSQLAAQLHHGGPAVGARITPVPQREGQFAAWEIVVTDGATTYPALDVLEEARLYWRRMQ